MLIKNQQIDIKNNKIISLQNKSTPGIYKIFDVNPYSTYKINLIEYDRGDSKNILWISNMNKNTLLKTNINNQKEFLYKNKKNSKLKIGILFIFPKFNNYFYIKDIIILEIEFKNIIKRNRISLVIPCLSMHFIHIQSLLEIYKQQTLLPDEVISKLLILLNTIFSHPHLAQTIILPSSDSNS